MRIRLVIAVFLSLFVALALTGCESTQANVAPGSQATGRASSHMSDQTDVRTCVYQVKPEMSDVRLEMDVRLTDGAMAWVLVDPAGDVRWKDEAPGSCRMSKKKSFEPIEGEWKLKLALAQATGEYEALWRAE